MAHAYFHTIGANEVIVDHRGVEIGDLAEARERAVAMARSIMDHAWGIADFGGWFVHVTDEEDDELLTVPFAAAIGALH